LCDKRPKKTYTYACDVCSKGFDRPPSRLWNGTVCSRNCARRTKWRRKKQRTGYILLTNLHGEQILEHRWVMEQHLGRPLEKTELVHHINHKKHDNRLENLQVVTHWEHCAIHAKDAVLTIPCDNCGTPFKRIRHLANEGKNRYCSNVCRIAKVVDLSHVTRECPHCGLTFSRPKHLRPKFCSPDCYQASRKIGESP